MAWKILYKLVHTPVLCSDVTSFLTQVFHSLNTSCNKIRAVRLKIAVLFGKQLHIDIPDTGIECIRPD